MSLVFSGGTIVDTTFNLGTTAKKKALFDGVKAALTSAGMTITDSLPSQVITMNNNAGNANDGETVVVLGKTYTFKTSINNSNDGEILVEGTGVGSWTNFISAVNLTAGAGTKYSSATTAGDGTVTASNLAGSAADTVTWTANSQDDAGGAVSETCASASWNAATLSEASFIAATAETPDYLVGKWNIIYNGEGNNTTWTCLNRDGSNAETWLQDQYFTYTDNADQRILASKFGFWCFKPGSASDFTSFGGQVMSIPEPMRCKKVTGATNATPIEITTNVVHGYTTGDTVKVAYVEGNTAANGAWTITVTGTTTFTLDTSVGNGTFSGSLGVVGSTTGGLKEIFEYHFGQGSVRSGGGPQFRTDIQSPNNMPGHFNGTNYARTVYWTTTTRTVVAEDDGLWPWYSGAKVLDPPLYAISEDGATTWALTGQIYNCALLRQSTPMDTLVTDAQANQWVTMTDSNSDGTFMVLK